MSATTTKQFGWVLARVVQVVFALQAVFHTTTVVSAVRQDGSVWGTVLPGCLAVASVAVVVFAQTGIVRVGPDRVRWRDRGLRAIEVPFARVQDVRTSPTRNGVELVTTEGVVLPLPVWPTAGARIRELVLAGRQSDRSP